MKNQAATQQADTRKTSFLIKKYMKENFNVKASVKSQSYTGGISITISYNGGPDPKYVQAIFSCLQEGSFNGMEDIYEYDKERDDLIIDGYKLQSYKFVFIYRKISNEIEVKMCEVVSKKMSFAGVHKFDGDLHKIFENMFGNAWNWSELVGSQTEELNFVTDDIENIEITGVESDSNGSSFGLVFTYKYNGQEYKTVKGQAEIIETSEIETEEYKTEAEDSNIDIKDNFEDEKPKEFKEGQKVKIFYENSLTTYIGTITKVASKSLMVNIEGTNRLAMLSTAKVEILEDVENDTALSNGEEATIIKLLPFYSYILELRETVKIDDRSIEDCKKVLLTEEGIKRINIIKEEYNAGSIDVVELIDELKDLAVNFAIAPLNILFKKEDKIEKEIFSLIDKIDTQQKFDKLLKTVEDQKIKFQSIKKGFEMELVKFANGNIYVKNILDGKLYFSLPNRFSFHFKVKEES